MFDFDHLPLILAQDKGDQPPAPKSTDKAPAAKDDTAPAKDAAATDGGETGTQQPTQTPTPRSPDPFGGLFFPIIIGFFVLMIIFSMRGQRKEKKRREQLLGSIKKGDRVQSIGGILGTIVEVRDNKVVVKIDENTNTRMHFAKSAIQTVLEDKSETEESKLDEK